MNHSSRDLTHTTLLLLFIGLLMGGTFWILKPFLLALIWAIMIVVATWPLLLGVQSRLGGHRWLAVTVMIAAAMMILIAPITLAVVTVVDHSLDIVAGSKSLVSFAKAPPPDWVERLPVVGAKIASEWRRLAAGGAAGLADHGLPYVDNILRWFISQVGGLGLMLFHFALTLLISGILYFNGEVAANSVRRFAARLGGAAGRERDSSRRPSDSRRGTRRRGNGGDPVGPCGHRPGAGRHSLRGDPDRSHAVIGDRADRTDAGAGSSGDLVVLGWPCRLGHGAFGVDRGGRHDG